jgi:hypothetical protein
MRKGKPFLILRFRDFGISFYAPSLTNLKIPKFQNQKFLSSAEGPYIDGIGIAFIRI